VCEYYSVTKKNEILSFTDKWIELENIMLSKPGFKRQSSRFPSYVEDRSKYKYKPYHTHTHTHTCTYDMFAKVGWLEEMKEKKKK
jgi:hypothetical protein